MPITNISIENFKGVGERVDIPLRPITLLFGANSAGKSTILQALLYLREMLENKNPEPGKLIASGGEVDLGGFENTVHNHDRSQKITIGVNIELNDDGLWSPESGLDLPDPGMWASKVEKIGIKISVSALGFESYEVYINDILAGKIGEQKLPGSQFAKLHFKQTDEKNIELVGICRATSAAPT